MKNTQKAKRRLSTILLLLSFTALGQTPEPHHRQALSSLVETERTFARTCVEQGMRASFLAFFAENAILFWPHPVNAREALLKQPAPAARPPVTLNWEPVRADMSSAGDLGYTTGPTLTTDDKQNHKPIRHGYYFSIWRRQADGGWKVEVDIGTKTPATTGLPAPGWRAPASFSRLSNKPRSNGEENALLELERKFAVASNMSEAFLKLITEDAQLSHDGHFPVIDRNGIHAYLMEQQSSLQWEPIKAVIANSNDFAYTYGKYTRKTMQASPPVVKTGYYVHVWRRDEKEQWKLAVEVQAAPLPDKE